MGYPASIHCRGNVFTKPLPNNGHIRQSIKMHDIEAGREAVGSIHVTQVRV
jgi:hypothetical protein